MAVLYENLKERFVEVFIVGDIFKDAGGDTVKEGEVCCCIFLGGCFPAMIAYTLVDVFPGVWS